MHILASEDKVYETKSEGALTETTSLLVFIEENVMDNIRFLKNYSNTSLRFCIMHLIHAAWTKCIKI